MVGPVPTPKIPSVTFPSPNEWPKTLRTITAISKAPLAKITSTAHGFTATDIGFTQVMFQQVKGMIQINGLPGTIQSVIDTNNFTVNIDTSQFFSYTSAGVANIMTGIPPVTTQGSQVFNTPFENIL